jgi:glycerol-3-phosphate dehydrogenase (NAD(P)+)
MADHSLSITVLGAGAWGTTLSWMLASSGHAVRLWCLEPDLAEEMRATRRNSRYRPEIELPPGLGIHTDLEAALADTAVVVVASPSRFVRGVLERARPHLAGSPLLISASKGLEESTGLRVSQVIRQVLPADLPLAALSGPNLSREIALGMPTVSVAASPDEEIAARAQGILTTPLFRVYRNCDIIGLELCGALKNVLAIGAGISEGLGLGANVKGALVTRGLAEMTRLGLCLGAQPATFWGAAGVGDLVATSISHDSRNWNVGWRLAQGETWAEINRGSISVAEGVYTAQAARRLGHEHGIALPLTEAICQVLFEDVPAPRALEQLMTRPEKAEEDWGYTR